MEISGKAYFVSDPRRIEDLTVLHLVEKEHPFEVVKTVELAKIDYENFITDRAYRGTKGPSRRPERSA